MNLSNVKATDGYNYERIEYEGTTLGIWDISGNEDVKKLKDSLFFYKKKQFLPLIATFYENIKINAILFMIRFENDVFEPETSKNPPNKVLHQNENTGALKKK